MSPQKGKVFPSVSYVESLAVLKAAVEHVASQVLSYAVKVQQQHVLQAELADAVFVIEWAD